MRLGVLFMLTVSMSGCSWLVHDRDNDYLESEIQPVIKVPADVANVSLKPQLPIPNVETKALPETFKVPRPNPLVLDVAPEPTVSLAEISKLDVEANLLKDGNGTPILRLNIEFAQAWSELGEALKKAQINITDLNRSIGTYYIALEQEGEKQEVGFWAGLFGAEPQTVTLPLEVKLNQARSGVYIAIHKDAENLASDEQAQAILEQIQSQF